MANETIDLGSAPPDEDCAQVGTPEYEIVAYDECKRYIQLLRKAYEAHHSRSFPENVRLRVRSNEHDFGVYYSVQASFNINNEEAVDAAYWLESSSPLTWEVL